MIGTHPHPEQLAAFRLGKLGDDELAEGCAILEDVLVNLEAKAA